MAITPSQDNIENNIIPIDLQVSDSVGNSEGIGMDVGSTPSANTDNPKPENPNIIPSGGGSIVKGFLKTQNFNAGTSGWSIDGEGNVEFNDGNFRGDVTGASGTFSGSITATSGTIGGWTINTDKIYHDGATDALSAGLASGDYPFYAGKKYADRATAPFKVEPSGKLTCNNIVATGTINAQAGYLSAGVYVDTVNGLVCESEGINVGIAGHVRGGQTDYNTGTGFWLGYDTAAYKFSIGNSADTSKLLLWDGTDLIVNGSPISFNPFYGDGNDGDVTISGATTLTADMYYNNLTINDGITLNTGGYRVFSKGILNLNTSGKIARNGNDGSNGINGNNSDGGFHAAKAGGAGGTAIADAFFKGAIAGETGAGGNNTDTGTGSRNANVGANGTATTTSMGVDGTAGGNAGGGGAGGAGAGGADANGGTAGTVTLTTTPARNYVLAVNMLDFSGAGYVKITSSASSGSGAGGGSGVGDGGYAASGGSGAGSGGSGAIVFVAARFIIGSGDIESVGGAGGDGGDGGDGQLNRGAGGAGGGAAGGSGGVCVVVYTNKAATITSSVAGGAGGTAGTAGTNGGGTSGDGNTGTDGTAGLTGTLIELQV